MTKIGLMVATILFSGSMASAYSHQVQSCSYTAQVTGQFGQTVYGCGMYPMTVTVPDAQDVSAEFRAVYSKLSELEARIKVLEQKNP